MDFNIYLCTFIKKGEFARVVVGLQPKHFGLVPIPAIFQKTSETSLGRLSAHISCKASPTNEISPTFQRFFLVPPTINYHQNNDKKKRLKYPQNLNLSKYILNLK